MRKKEPYYYAILSNKLSLHDCKWRRRRSYVPRRKLMIILVDGHHRLIRKIYQHEFGNGYLNKKWRKFIVHYQHPRVLRWLKKIEKKERRKK